MAEDSSGGVWLRSAGGTAWPASSEAFPHRLLNFVVAC